MITRGENYQEFPLNICGSSTFGRYPKISQERTYNMFISDEFLVDYAGYRSLRDEHDQPVSFGSNGRAIFTSNILDRLVAVISNQVILFSISYHANTNNPYIYNPVYIGTLTTYTSDVFIAENNAGQIAITDGANIYVYNPRGPLQVPPVKVWQQSGPDFTINFIPGMITFHDSYFVCAASQDQGYVPPANNTWRLSEQNNGTVWPTTAQGVGLLQTKPDNCVGVVRFPSRGNLIFVFGENVTEPWYDVGYTLFPYQRNSSANIDYGCVSRNTIAATDEIVAWLGQNEKSGPIILSSNGDMPEKISTDGIDYFMSNLNYPARSEAFMYRQDGHLFYHINFYDPTDNVSLFYDFNTKKFYHASDENTNYFIAKQVAFLDNQYYFITRENGLIYAFDTTYTTYDDKIIPRVRVCKNVRLPSQEYRIINDLGFTIEQGTTDYQVQQLGPIYMETQDGNLLVTQGEPQMFVTQSGNYLITQDGNYLIDQSNDMDVRNLIYQQMQEVQNNPRVDLSYSIDGGESFSNDIKYYMNPIGQRKNMLRFWNLGVANDFVAQFRFWGIGRFVATDGIVNVRK